MARERPSTPARSSRRFAIWRPSHLFPISHTFFSVVTQFQTNKITQYLVQNGKKIDIPGPKFDGIPATTNMAITPEFCTAAFKAFSDRNRFAEVGGFDQLNKALQVPMVLVMSIWDDHYSNMLWLDSSYPPEKAGTPGGDRGDCAQSSGTPKEIESSLSNAFVSLFLYTHQALC